MPARMDAAAWGIVPNFPRMRAITGKFATSSKIPFMPDQFLDQFDHFPDYVWDALLTAVAIAIGLIVKFLLSLLLRRKPKEGKPHFSATRSTLSRLGQPFSYFLPLLTLNFLLPLMKMRTNVTPVVNKLVEILLTISFATVLIGVIKVFEDYVYHTFDIQKADNLKERKIRTQLQFIRRLAISLILILLFTSGHMFNHIRKVPYVAGDGRGGVSYFAGGFSNQYGLETQIVSAMCKFP